MQKLAPEDAMPMTGHPSAEELAAYIDRNLGKEEAARVTEHLASCDDCFDVYSTTAQFLLADEPAPPETNVVRFPRRKLSQRRRTVIPYKIAATAAARWFPIAALLLVGVGVGGLHFLMPPPGLVASKVTPRLPNPAQTDQPMWVGPTYRGEGGEEDVKVDEASFRMGVQLVNLQASLKAGRKDDAEDVIARILGLLKPQTFAQDLYDRYKGITGTLENHKAPSELLPEAARLAKESRQVFDVTPLDLGQWVEAGRMAALSHDPSFFQQADTRSFLRRLYWRDKLRIGDTTLDPVSRESLGRISEIVSKGDLQASDYTQLRTQLDKILEKYYPMM
jgi:hypothetical protein